MTRRADQGGIVFILAAILMIVTMNTMAKQLAELGIPVVQLTWARFTFHLLTAIPIVALLAPARLRTARPGIQLSRSAILMGMNFCFFVGLQFMPLAEVTAMMFATPIFVIGLSVLLLREKVGLRRWLGVAAGIVGIVLILKPSPSMDVVYLVPLGAALFYAGYQLLTRFVAGDEHPLTTFLYTPVVGVAVTSVALPFVWVAPSAEAWLFLVLSGVFGALGHLLMINAYSRSEASLLAPFGYSSVLWATLFGWIAFGWLPDLWAVAGGLLIIGSSLYIWQRERRLHRARRPAPEAEGAP